MQITHSIKQFSTGPDFVVNLRNLDGTYVDLSESPAVLFRALMVGDIDVFVVGSMTITDEATAEVTFDFADSPMTTSGLYACTVSIQDAGLEEEVFPANGYYFMEVQQDLLDDPDDPEIDLFFATTADARAMGYSVTRVELLQAQGFIEVAAGRTIEELENVTLGTADAARLKKATVYQAVWMRQNQDADVRNDISKVRTAGLSGESAEFNADGVVIAPLARRLLSSLSWTRSRTIPLHKSNGGSSLTPNPNFVSGSPSTQGAGWFPLA